MAAAAASAAAARVALADARADQVLMHGALLGGVDGCGSAGNAAAEPTSKRHRQAAGSFEPFANGQRGSLGDGDADEEPGSERLEDLSQPSRRVSWDLSFAEREPLAEEDAI